MHSEGFGECCVFSWHFFHHQRVISPRTVNGSGSRDISAVFWHSVVNSVDYLRDERERNFSHLLNSSRKESTLKDMICEIGKYKKLHSTSVHKNIFRSFKGFVYICLNVYTEKKEILQLNFFPTMALQKINTHIAATM